MDVFLSKIENTITQLSTMANSDSLSEKDQQLVDNTIPILLKDMLHFINGDLITKLDSKALKFILVNKSSLLNPTDEEEVLTELRTRKRRSHHHQPYQIPQHSQQSSFSATQKQVLSDILIKTIDLILKTVPVYCNFDRKQETYWTLYRLPEDDFIGQFLRSLDRFYIGWIQSFQNKPKTRQNFITISGIFCLSIKNGVMYNDDLQLDAESSHHQQKQQQQRMGGVIASQLSSSLSSSLAPQPNQPLQLTKMYKSFTSKLSLFNETTNYESNSDTVPLVLDPTFFPKIRYHSSPRKKPSLCLVGYQKAFYINRNLEMDMSFEERRASDCCALEGLTPLSPYQQQQQPPNHHHHDQGTSGEMMMVSGNKNVVEMIISSQELGFKSVIVELSEFGPLFDYITNVTILKEKVKDPYEVIHSFNVTSYPIIDSKLCDDDRMIHSMMMTPLHHHGHNDHSHNRLMDCSADI